MLKKLALLAMFVCGSIAAQNVTAPATLDPSQVYNSGNIVQPTTTSTGSTWVNGVYQDQLTCWAWGNPGYCGPNAIVRPDGNINFSYGTTDLHQIRAIASVLPGGGSGLRVNGYNFGFTAKNGNGWDGGGLDSLSAYVSFYGSDGNSVRHDYYNLNWKFDWTTFNYNKTFDTPFAAQDLSTVRYGFVGRDNNFWAGPYGPEIYGVNFSLKYSVDPCIKDPLYSPTCPGYMEALNKLLPPPVVVEPVTTSSLTTATSTVVEPVAAPTTISASTAPSSQPSMVAPVVSAPAPVTTSSSSSVSSSAAAASSSANNREASGANTAQAMSIISRNQERDRETLSVAQSAVSAATAAAAAAQQEAVAVAASAVANSTSNNAVLGTGPSNAGTGFRSAAVSNNVMSQTLSVQSVPGQTTISGNSMRLPGASTTSIGHTNNVDTAPALQIQSLTTTGPGSAVVETNVTVAPGFLTDRTNPINNIIEQRQTPPASTAATTGPSVNTRAADNEAAGGVSLAVMAVAPQGYGDYLNFTLRDAAFYAPREVYRNQRNVDNARALRLLTNDSRHREMVEQQYRR